MKRHCVASISRCWGAPDQAQIGIANRLGVAALMPPAVSMIVSVTPLRSSDCTAARSRAIVNRLTMGSHRSGALPVRKRA